MLEDVGFVDVTIGPAADTFSGAGGEDKARAYEVYGYTFQPGWRWSECIMFASVEFQGAANYASPS
jgi:hypothetical protein